MMKTLLGFLFLLFALLASRVSAESELAHAWERIFFYANYRLEELLFGDDPNSNWIGSGCRGPAQRRCTFNEVSYIKPARNRRTHTLRTHPCTQFIHYISEGVAAGGPRYIIADNLDILTTNPETAARAIEVGGFGGNDIIPSKVYSNLNSFVAMYDRTTRFWAACDTDVSTEDQRRTLADYKSKLRVVLDRIGGLRGFVMQAKLAMDMQRIFPSDNNLANVYQIGDDPKERYNPIQWKTKQVTVSGRDFVVLDLDATALATPGLNDSPLKGRILEWMNLFWADSPRLPSWNGNFLRANRNHAAVRDAVKKCQDCLPAPAPAAPPARS
ncbi:hypothetical protein BX600DRAFT_497752 [Xylariales sp. PMI_506]|nr:hypothetical protein BX600DRAFT_497752 [Xylariales sp. PMI_506]